MLRGSTYFKNKYINKNTGLFTGIWNKLNVFPATAEPTFSPGDPGSGCVSILDPHCLIVQQMV